MYQIILKDIKCPAPALYINSRSRYLTVRVDFSPLAIRQIKYKRYVTREEEVLYEVCDVSELRSQAL